jgi:hypothetical protein
MQYVSYNLFCRNRSRQSDPGTRSAFNQSFRCQNLNLPVVTWPMSDERRPFLISHTRRCTSKNGMHALRRALRSCVLHSQQKEIERISDRRSRSHRLRPGVSLIAQSEEKKAWTFSSSQPHKLPSLEWRNVLIPLSNHSIVIEAQSSGHSASRTGRTKMGMKQAI